MRLGFLTLFFCFTAVDSTYRSEPRLSARPPTANNSRDLINPPSPSAVNASSQVNSAASNGNATANVSVTFAASHPTTSRSQPSFLSSNLTPLISTNVSLVSAAASKSSAQSSEVSVSVPLRSSRPALISSQVSVLRLSSRAAYTSGSSISRSSTSGKPFYRGSHNASGASSSQSLHGTKGTPIFVSLPPNSTIRSLETSSTSNLSSNSTSSATLLLHSFSLQRSQLPQHASSIAKRPSSDTQTAARTILGSEGDQLSRRTIQISSISGSASQVVSRPVSSNLATAFKDNKSTTSSFLTLTLRSNSQGSTPTLARVNGSTLISVGFQQVSTGLNSSILTADSGGAGFNNNTSSLRDKTLSSTFLRSQLANSSSTSTHSTESASITNVPYPPNSSAAEGVYSEQSTSNIDIISGRLSKSSNKPSASNYTGNLLGTVMPTYNSSAFSSWSGRTGPIMSTKNSVQMGSVIATNNSGTVRSSGTHLGSSTNNSGAMSSSSSQLSLATAVNTAVNTSGALSSKGSQQGRVTITSSPANQPEFSTTPKNTSVLSSTDAQSGSVTAINNSDASNNTGSPLSPITTTNNSDVLSQPGPVAVTNSSRDQPGYFTVTNNSRAMRPSRSQLSPTTATNNSGTLNNSVSVAGSAGHQSNVTTSFLSLANTTLSSDTNEQNTTANVTAFTTSVTRWPHVTASSKQEQPLSQSSATGNVSSVEVLSNSSFPSGTNFNKSESHIISGQSILSTSPLTSSNGPHTSSTISSSQSKGPVRTTGNALTAQSSGKSKIANTNQDNTSNSQLGSVTVTNTSAALSSIGTQLGSDSATNISGALGSSGGQLSSITVANNSGSVKPGSITVTAKSGALSLTDTQIGSVTTEITSAASNSPSQLETVTAKNSSDTLISSGSKVSSVTMMNSSGALISTSTQLGNSGSAQLSSVTAKGSSGIVNATGNQMETNTAANISAALTSKAPQLGSITATSNSGAWNQQSAITAANSSGNKLGPITPTSGSLSSSSSQLGSTIATNNSGTLNTSVSVAGSAGTQSYVTSSLRTRISTTPSSSTNQQSTNAIVTAFTSNVTTRPHVTASSEQVQSLSQSNATGNVSSVEILSHSIFPSGINPDKSEPHIISDQLISLTSPLTSSNEPRTSSTISSAQSLGSFRTTYNTSKRTFSGRFNTFDTGKGSISKDISTSHSPSLNISSNVTDNRFTTGFTSENLSASAPQSGTGASSLSLTASNTLIGSMSSKDTPVTIGGTHSKPIAEPTHLTSSFNISDVLVSTYTSTSKQNTITGSPLSSAMSNSGSVITPINDNSFTSRISNSSLQSGILFTALPAETFDSQSESPKRTPAVTSPEELSGTISRPLNSGSAKFEGASSMITTTVTVPCTHSQCHTSALTTICIFSFPTPTGTECATRTELTSTVIISDNSKIVSVSATVPCTATGNIGGAGSVPSISAASVPISSLVSATSTNNVPLSTNNTTEIRSSPSSNGYAVSPQLTPQSGNESNLLGIASTTDKGKETTITTTVAIPCTKPTCKRNPTSEVYTTVCSFTIPLPTAGECVTDTILRSTVEISDNSKVVNIPATIPCSAELNQTSTAVGLQTYSNSGTEVGTSELSATRRLSSVPTTAESTGISETPSFIVVTVPCRHTDICSSRGYILSTIYPPQQANSSFTPCASETVLTTIEGSNSVTFTTLVACTAPTAESIANSPEISNVGTSETIPTVTSSSLIAVGSTQKPQFSKIPHRFSKISEQTLYNGRSSATTGKPSVPPATSYDQVRPSNSATFVGEQSSETSGHPTASLNVNSELTSNRALTSSSAIYSTLSKSQEAQSLERGSRSQSVISTTVRIPCTQSSCMNIPTTTTYTTVCYFTVPELTASECSTQTTISSTVAVSENSRKVSITALVPCPTTTEARTVISGSSSPTVFRETHRLTSVALGSTTVGAVLKSTIQNQSTLSRLITSSQYVSVVGGTQEETSSLSSITVGSSVRTNETTLKITSPTQVSNSQREASQPTTRKLPPESNEAGPQTSSTPKSPANSYSESPRSVVVTLPCEHTEICSSRGYILSTIYPPQSQRSPLSFCASETIFTALSGTETVVITTSVACSTTKAKSSQETTSPQVINTPSAPFPATISTGTIIRSGPSTTGEHVLSSASTGTRLSSGPSTTSEQVLSSASTGTVLSSGPSTTSEHVLSSASTGTRLSSGPSTTGEHVLSSVSTGTVLSSGPSTTSEHVLSSASTGTRLSSGPITMSEQVLASASGPSSQKVSLLFSQSISEAVRSSISSPVSLPHYFSSESQSSNLKTYRASVTSNVSPSMNSLPISAISSSTSSHPTVIAYPLSSYQSAPITQFPTALSSKTRGASVSSIQSTTVSIPCSIGPCVETVYTTVCSFTVPVPNNGECSTEGVFTSTVTISRNSKVFSMTANVPCIGVITTASTVNTKGNEQQTQFPSAESSSNSGPTVGGAPPISPASSASVSQVPSSSTATLPTSNSSLETVASPSFSSQELTGSENSPSTASATQVPPNYLSSTTPVSFTSRSTQANSGTLTTITTIVSIPCSHGPCSQSVYTTPCSFTAPVPSSGECSTEDLIISTVSVSSNTKVITMTATIPCTSTASSGSLITLKTLESGGQAPNLPSALETSTNVPVSSVTLKNSPTRSQLLQTGKQGFSSEVSRSLAVTTSSAHFITGLPESSQYTLEQTSELLSAIGSASPVVSASPTSTESESNSSSSESSEQRQTLSTIYVTSDSVSYSSSLPSISAPSGLLETTPNVSTTFSTQLRTYGTQPLTLSRSVTTSSEDTQASNAITPKQPSTISSQNLVSPYSATEAGFQSVIGSTSVSQSSIIPNSATPTNISPVISKTRLNSSSTISTTVTIPCSEGICTQHVYTTVCSFTVPVPNGGECSTEGVLMSTVSVSSNTKIITVTANVPCTVTSSSLLETTGISQIPKSGESMLGTATVSGLLGSHISTTSVPWTPISSPLQTLSEGTPTEVPSSSQFATAYPHISSSLSEGIYELTTNEHTASTQTSPMSGLSSNTLSVSKPLTAQESREQSQTIPSVSGTPVSGTPVSRVSNDITTQSASTIRETLTPSGTTKGRETPGSPTGWLSSIVTSAPNAFSQKEATSHLSVQKGTAGQYQSHQSTEEQIYSSASPTTTIVAVPCTQLTCQSSVYTTPVTFNVPKQTEANQCMTSTVFSSEVVVSSATQLITTTLTLPCGSTLAVGEFHSGSSTNFQRDTVSQKSASTTTKESTTSSLYTSFSSSITMASTRGILGSKGQPSEVATPSTNTIWIGSSASSLLTNTAIQTAQGTLFHQSAELTSPQSTSPVSSETSVLLPGSTFHTTLTATRSEASSHSNSVYTTVWSLQVPSTTESNQCVSRTTITSVINLGGSQLCTVVVPMSVPCGSTLPSSAEGAVLTSSSLLSDSTASTVISTQGQGTAVTSLLKSRNLTSSYSGSESNTSQVNTATLSPVVSTTQTKIHGAGSTSELVSSESIGLASSTPGTSTVSLSGVTTVVTVQCTHIECHKPLYITTVTIAVPQKTSSGQCATTTTYTSAVVVSSATATVVTTLELPCGSAIPGSLTPSVPTGETTTVLGKSKLRPVGTSIAVTSSVSTTGSSKSSIAASERSLSSTSSAAEEFTRILSTTLISEKSEVSNLVTPSANTPVSSTKSVSASESSLSFALTPEFTRTLPTNTVSEKSGISVPVAPSSNTAVFSTNSTSASKGSSSSASSATQQSVGTPSTNAVSEKSGTPVASSSNTAVTSTNSIPAPESSLSSAPSATKQSVGTPSTNAVSEKSGTPVASSANTAVTSTNSIPAPEGSLSSASSATQQSVGTVSTNIGPQGSGPSVPAVSSANVSSTNSIPAPESSLSSAPSATQQSVGTTPTNAVSEKSGTPVGSSANTAVTSTNSITASEGSLSSASSATQQSVGALSTKTGTQKNGASITAVSSANTPVSSTNSISAPESSISPAPLPTQETTGTASTTAQLSSGLLTTSASLSSFATSSTGPTVASLSEQQSTVQLGTSQGSLAAEISSSTLETSVESLSSIPRGVLSGQVITVSTLSPSTSCPTSLLTYMVIHSSSTLLEGPSATTSPLTPQEATVNSVYLATPEVTSSATETSETKRSSKVPVSLATSPISSPQGSSPTLSSATAPPALVSGEGPTPTPPAINKACRTLPLTPSLIGVGILLLLL